jgi:hypothetical protein
MKTPAQPRMPEIAIICYIRIAPSPRWHRIPRSHYLALKYTANQQRPGDDVVQLAQSWYLIINGRLVPWDPLGDEATPEPPS